MCQVEHVRILTKGIPALMQHNSDRMVNRMAMSSLFALFVKDVNAVARSIRDLRKKWGQVGFQQTMASGHKDIEDVYSL